jgi:DNA polymerase III epsilon subunit family exonuclease
MHPANYTFVALDLETTGLDTKNDTIIEIAAIRFQIELIWDVYTMTDVVEHSQLIHPGRPLTQEISMITGITPAMLEGRPSWEMVRGKVREFIGNAVIVGHNVLFDIAVLRSHGIDLSQNIVIDTFELSEILSQDVESLNLGFLAERYGLIDPSEDQHRALTDTRVSIRLLLRYLGEVSRLGCVKRQIWDTLSTRDESQTLATLSRICHGEKEDSTDISKLFADLVQPSSLPTLPHSNPPTFQPSHIPTCIREINHSTDELTLIQDTLREKGKITLVTPGYKVSQWMSGFLKEHGIENMMTISPEKWCSVEYIRELIQDDRCLNRKEMILTLKIMYWMTETTTGLLDEMKFYGDERKMIDIYRCRADEYPIWRTTYESRIYSTPILIADAYSFTTQIAGRYTIVKDLPLLEDIVRRRSSQEISFDELYKTLSEHIWDASILTMIDIIRGIYESTSERPQWFNPYPPGDHGETYFVTQSMLWHRGNSWLIQATRSLEENWKEWKKHSESDSKNQKSRKTKIDIEYIENCITILIRYHTIWDADTNMILSIQEGKTKITYIHRSVSDIMHPLTAGYTLYGIHISRPETSGFLMREYGLDISHIQSSNRAISIYLTHWEYDTKDTKAGTVILTTSLKHARDIGSELRQIYGKSMNILIQWLSGGKGKMLSIFVGNTEKTILIGIIDTWRDEYHLWKHAQNIIIAKLPFDPPTDPYFLARTVGMSNNFSEYSGPIVSVRMTTLIERIASSGYDRSIRIADTRLTETEWGKKIAGEIL